MHVDPVDRAHPLYGEIDAFLAESVGGIEGVRSFHDLRLVGREQCCFVILDLVVDKESAAGASDELRRRIEERFPQVAKVVINVEPLYSY